MKIKNLSLKNIGPFLDAHLDFITDENQKPPVIIITGENGTGKTIVLDAIRGLLLGYLGNVNRNIVRNEEDFCLKSLINYNGVNRFVDASSFYNKGLSYEIKDENGKGFYDLSSVFNDPKKSENNRWIANYWTSKSDNSNYNLSSLKSIEPKLYLKDVLNGIQSNVEVLQLITYFDYLKTSDSPKEKKEGEFLFETLKKIIKLSLIDGEFRYVERKTLMPIVSQNGFEVSLDKLSSGNLYLIQRIISLLGQMYSVYVLNDLKLEEMLSTPGLLLIDEAENHLHPKWQKTFLNSILNIFPNLQIIITTHSPFIVSSVENSKVFVCKSEKDHSIIVDETDVYSNKPIEEILQSEVFSTNPFNAEISDLMSKRKIAIESKDFANKEAIEEKLKAINPEYFSYFDIDKLIKSISK
jgi:predicted ATP-binding protein involved in virulence